MAAWTRRREVTRSASPAQPAGQIPTALDEPVDHCRQRAGSGGLGLAQPLADHVGHAVAAHRHAVERVGDLHRALLVGDDDQLAATRAAPP